MVTVIWRIDALETPCWTETCVRCGVRRPHRTRDRFRVNAQGARHDVWLLYGCLVCGATRKRRLIRRRRAETFASGELAGYFENEPQLVRRHAFATTSRQVLAHRVVASSPQPAQDFVARIEQPEFCALRWDRFLADRLGWSRSRVTRAWVSDAAFRLRGSVRDGQRVRISCLPSLLAPL